MKKLMAMIGQRGIVKANGWTVAVEIQDVKKVFGTEKLLARSIFGEEHWINRDSFTEITNAPLNVVLTSAVTITN